MAQLPIDQAIIRFKENEDRFEKFVNNNAGYTADTGEAVESIPAFLARVESEIGATGAIAITESNKQATEEARDEAVLAKTKAIAAQNNALLASTAATSALGFINKTTLTALNADLAHAADTLAYVTADPVQANNGIYRKVGASASGFWVWSFLTPNLLLSPNQNNGAPSEMYNSGTFSGWGVIVKTSLKRVARVAIKRGTAKAFTNSSFNLKVFALAESTSSIESGTLIQSFEVPVSAWNALNIGDDYIVSLNTPFDTAGSPFIAVTVSSDVSGFDWINIQQTGFNGGIHSENEMFIGGRYRVTIGGAWSSITPPENYGLYVHFFDRADLTLEDRFTEQDEINATLEAACIVKEDNGVPGSVYQSGLLAGFGAIVQTNLNQISTFVIKRHAITASYVHSTFTVRLIECDSASAGAIASGTVIQSYAYSISEWLAKSDGSNVIFALDTPHTVIDGKFYAVLVYSDYSTFDQIAVKQTGDDFPVNASYQLGIYKPNYSSGWIATNGDGVGSYGIWLSLQSTAISEQISGEVASHLPSLLSNYFKALPIAENPLKSCPVFNQRWLKRDKDIYAVLWGDSITAWQSTMDKAEEGVSQVPPVCDRKGLANRVWKALRFGHPLYRRFDHGKNALIGAWDSSWSGGDAAFFTESGTFTTHYYSASNQASADVNYTHPSYTTVINGGTCPVGPFHETENQRNIPKRLSGSANASVSFTIPSGYEKADFIYHSHTQGDDVVTVSVTSGNGKLLAKATNVAWGGIEANGFVFSMQETHASSDDGYDSGLLQKRLHFKKTNIADNVTVTITKSSNTSKFLLYWGATYWGTASEPYATHLITTGRGGYTLPGLYTHRIYDVSYFKPDLLIYEHTLINSSGGVANTSDAQAYETAFGTLATFLSSVGIEAFTMLPHTTTTLVNNAPEKYRAFWNYGKWASISNNVPVVDVERIFYKIWQFLYPNNEVAYSTWLNTCMFDGSTHPNTKGFDIFESVLIPIFDQV